LNFVATSRARNRIRTYLKKEERKKTVSVGRDILGQELRKYQLNLNKLIKENAFEDYVKRQNQGNLNNLFANVALGHVGLKHLVEKVISKDDLDRGSQEEAPQPGALERIFRRRGLKKAAIRVGGQGDVLTHMAQCCNPLPGDLITGFVTRGKGVSVHFADCPMILASEEERRIPVAWDDHPKGTYYAHLKTVAVDKPGILAKLSRTITLAGMNITEAQIRTTNDQKAVNIFSVCVKDIHQVRKLIGRLEEIDGVISVERIQTLT